MKMANYINVIIYQIILFVIFLFIFERKEKFEIFKTAYVIVFPCVYIHTV